MSAFHKALERVFRVPMFEVHIFCTGPDADTNDGECSEMHGEYDALACPTKWDAVKNARVLGWTWDEDGNWLCAKCSEGGEA